MQYKIQIRNEAGQWEDLGPITSDQVYLFHTRKSAEYFCRTRYPGPLQSYARVVIYDLKEG